jgi:hypothetical protein
MRTSALIAASGGAALLLGAAGPAAGGERPQVDQWTALEQRATFSWVEDDRDDSSGRPGTVHVGGMLLDKAYGVTDVFGYFSDWQCEPGQLPGDEGCVVLGEYEIATAGATLEVDVRSGSAHLTGDVVLFDFTGEAPEIILPVDVRWSSDGSVIRERVHHSDLSPTAKVKVHQQGRTWAGLTATGTVGDLVLGDEPGEVTEHGLWSADTRYFFWQRGGDGPPDDGGGMG